jgi:hypothetical protein
MTEAGPKNVVSWIIMVLFLSILLYLLLDLEEVNDAFRSFGNLIVSFVSSIAYRVVALDLF